MKSFIALGLAFCGIALGAVPGFDISHYQATPYKFKDAYSSGARFVIIKVRKVLAILSLGFRRQHAREDVRR